MTHPFHAMSRARQLVLTLTAATVIAVLGSHALAAWLKVLTKAGIPYSYGTPTPDSTAYLAGSSLAGNGISWDEAAAQLQLEIQTWGVPGGSPLEWEQFQTKAPGAQASFIVVSAYDLEESRICDFRADVVPLGTTIAGMRDVHADWPEMKRTISQYPLKWLRNLFPTLGRSTGILGALRIKINRLIRTALNNRKLKRRPCRPWATMDRTMNIESSGSATGPARRSTASWPRCATIISAIRASTEPRKWRRSAC